VSGIGVLGVGAFEHLTDSKVDRYVSSRLSFERSRGKQQEYSTL